MRYIKNYTSFLLEKKNIELPWCDFFNRNFRRVVGNNKEAKIEKLQKFLSKDIFNSVLNKSIILSDTDKKLYSQSNTIDKFAILMKSEYNNQMTDIYYDDLGNIKDFLSDTGTTLAMLDVSDFEHLVDKANEYHERLASGISPTTSSIRTDETENTDVFITYPNGWYWINLNTSFSEDEKKNMGHCGQDSGKILFSLRDDKKQSHVTASYDVNQKALYQIKGRGNTKPLPIYHKMIVDMVLNEKYQVEIFKTGSYKPELDFSLTDLPEDEMKAIYKQKPSLEMTDKMFEQYLKIGDYKSMLSMCVNGFVYTGYMSKADSNEKIQKIFDFIDEQKINPEKNKDIVKRFIESTILLTWKAAGYDDEILDTISSLGVPLDYSEYDIIEYPDIERLQKYFKIEINDYTLSHYIVQVDMVAFNYAISTKDFYLNNDMLESLVDGNVSFIQAEYFLSKIITSDYKMSLYLLTSYLATANVKNMTTNLDSKINMFISEFDLYIKDTVETIGSDIANMDSVNLNFDIKRSIIDKVFSYKTFDYDDIYDILYEFDNKGTSNIFNDMVLGIILGHKDYVKILEMIFEKRLDHKYIFKTISLCGANKDNVYKHISDIFNKSNHTKYCLQFLDKYFENICPDYASSKIDISPEMEKELKEIANDLPDFDRTYTYSTAYDYIVNYL